MGAADRATLFTVDPLMGPLFQPALYILGLSAVFLLAFRGRWADRAISVVLAAVWTSMALALWLSEILVSGALTWAGGLFLVQAGIFLWEGMIRKRLDFAPRAGPGPVTGGLFLFFSLLIHPLLGMGLGWKAWPVPLLGLPFHGVIFTFGLLLFLVRRFPRYILVLPLAWAALGGLAGFRAGEPRDYALLAALLAGSFLALPRRRTRPDPDGNLRVDTWYEHAARHHRAAGCSVLFLILVTCLIGFVRGSGEGILFLPARQLEASFTLLSAMFFGLWLSLPAWYSAGFRLLGWEAGRWLRMGRRLWDWLTTRWGGILLLLGLLLYAGWEIFDVVQGLSSAHATDALETAPLTTAGPAKAKESTEETTKDLVLAGLALLLLYAIYRARRRIIISEFLNHTGEEAMDSLAKGLASRLHNELASITSLYRTIDEAMPPQKGTVIGVKAGVEDLVEPLEDVLGPESSVKLGKIEIPIGLLLRGLSRIVRGPRLTGSLQKEGTDFLLVADLAGGGFSGSWKVSFRDLALEEKTDPTTAVYRMAEQLAYRIITAIGNLGSPRWEAVRHFTNALRYYRMTQVVKSDASPELRAAEAELIQALSMDHNFSQCYYNLGVIYQSLGVPESAQASYHQILAENPDWPEAYYALAMVFFETGQYERAAIFARKMIEIRPADARAWSLNGVARFMHRQEAARARGDLKQEHSGPAWDEIVQSFKIAAAVAWRSLCVAGLKRSSRSLSKERQLAVGCVNNLAIVSEDKGTGSNRHAILEQAFRLSPRDPKAHLVAGECLLEEKHWEAARTELYQVIGDALNDNDHVRRWACLLGTHAALWVQSKSRKNGNDVLSTYIALLSHVVPSEEMILASLGDGDGEQARKSSYGERLSYFTDMFRAIEMKLGLGAEAFTSPRRALDFLRALETETNPSTTAADLTSDQQAWAKAQELIRNARLNLEPDSARAFAEITTAIEILQEQGFLRQIEQQGLLSLQAKACLLGALAGGNRRLLNDAAQYAELSVAQQPGSPVRRWILAEIYSALGDFEEACNEREAALRLGPGYDVVTDLAALNRIARDYQRLFGPPDMSAPEERVRRGLRFFARILQIIESHRPSRTPLQCTAHAAAHFWLGRFHCALGETDQGLDHLRIAHTMKFRPVEVALEMANLYSRRQDYSVAERFYRDCVMEAWRAQRRDQEELLADKESIVSMEVEALLNCAMLWAERGVLLKRAARLCQLAHRRLLSAKLNDRKKLRILRHECLGWIRFQQGKIRESRKELETAALSSSAPRIQARLARVYDAAGKTGVLAREEAARKTKEALQKAVASGNGHGSGAFGLWQLSAATPAAPGPAA